MRSFRERVMEYTGGNTWVRRTEVPGPPGEPTRVEVRFVDCNDAMQGVVCGDEPIIGYGDRLNCHNDGYEWGDVESFVRQLQEFCLGAKAGNP
jgi:hypothetical protein